MRGNQEPPTLSIPEPDYFQFPPPNSYPSGSPDTFFPIQVQPSLSAASDSAQTPPSPVSYSKPRISRASTHTQPHQFQPPYPSHTHSKASASGHATPLSSRKHGHGHSSHRHSNVNSHAHTSTHSHTGTGTSHPSASTRKERSRQLSNTPRDTLINLTVSLEHQSREAKSMLASALVHLDSTKERLAREQELRRGVEEEKRVQGVKTTQAMMDAQRELMNKTEEARRFVMEMENEKNELTKARDVIQHLETEKDELEHALVRSRSTARSLKEKTVLLQAREEGRREGFEEGLRQGRVQHGVVDLTLLPSGDVGTGEVKAIDNGALLSRKLEGEVEEERSLRKIAEKEGLRTKMQLNQVERALDTERQRNRELDVLHKKLKAQMEEKVLSIEREWKARVDEEIRRREKEEKERRKLSRDVEREREREAKRREEEEIHRRRAEEAKRRDEDERRRREEIDIREEERRRRRMEREVRELREEKERLERERERETREAKEREDKEAKNIAAAVAAATTAAVEASKPASITSPEYQRIPYIAMPPPPAVPVARSGSSGSKKRSRRISSGSASSTGSGPLEMLQTPGPGGQRLSVIHEMSPNRSYDDDYDDGVPTIRVEDENGDEEEAPTPTQVPMGLGWGMPAPGGFGGPAWPQAEVPHIIPSGRTGYEPGMPQPDIPHILPPGRTGYEPGMPEPTIPQIVGPGYRASNRRGYNEVEMPTPNPNLLHPGGVGPGYPMQRKNSTSSTSSTIDINIEPPSRPPSTVDQPHLESRNHLSPNASPAAELPQEPALPIRPRVSHAPSSSGYGNAGMGGDWGSGGDSNSWGGDPGNTPSPYDYDASGHDTQPNSPVIPGVTVAMPQSAPPHHQRSTTPGMPGSIPVPPVPTVPGMENLPPGFVPQTITDKRGVSTPIWGGGVALPAAGGIGIPTSSSSGGGRTKTHGPYGNPLSKSQADEEEQGQGVASRSFGVAPPPPPSGFGFVPSPSIGGSRPLGGGMTPSMGGTRSLSPSGGSTIPFIPSSPNLGARGGSSLYGRSPGPGRAGQLPSSNTNEPTYNNPLRNRDDQEENDDDGFDHHTMQNTMRNATMGRRGSPAPPGGFIPPEEPPTAGDGFGSMGGGTTWGEDASAWGTGGGASTGGAGAAASGVIKKKKGGKKSRA